MASSEVTLSTRPIHGQAVDNLTMVQSDISTACPCSGVGPLLGAAIIIAPCDEMISRYTAPVDADGGKVENRCCTAHHVQGNPGITQSIAELPLRIVYLYR